MLRRLVAQPAQTDSVVPQVTASASGARKRLPRAPKGTPRDQRRISTKRRVAEVTTLLAKIDAAKHQFSESRNRPRTVAEQVEIPVLEASLPEWQWRVRHLLAAALPAVRQYLGELTLLRRAHSANTTEES